MWLERVKPIKFHRSIAPDLFSPALSWWTLATMHWYAQRSARNNSDRSRSTMNNLPSPYPEEQDQRESGQAQECEMLYDYPPHAADFPQPDYPPMQQPYSSPTEMDGHLPAYADGYSCYAGVQPGYAHGQQPGANYINYAETQQLEHQQARRPFYTWAWKSWKSLWVALTGLALLLLLTASIAYAYFQVHSTPEKTLQDYCSAVKKEDGQALYNTYSSSAQNQ